jgi:Uma2 family endonuclease
MTTATTPEALAALTPLEMPGGPVARVPSLDELYRLTEVPDRRVVFRGVDWAFYEELVDSLPEGSHIHVDYDGRNLELMAMGPKHDTINRRLDKLIGIIAREWDIPYAGMGQTTWKRRQVARGLESDQSYYFLPEKRAQAAVAMERGSDEIDDFPNPDLALEVDISRPQVDRAGIYAALRVAEVWRFQHDGLIIERLTPEGTYAAVDASGFLPVRAEDIRRWVVEGPGSEWDWEPWARAEVRRKHGAEPREENAP